MKKITFLLFFMTFCVWHMNAQFTEGFDTEIPSSWTIVNNDGGTYTWDFQTQYPQAGAGHARIHWEAAAHQDYLITPQFAVTAGVSDRISFYAGIDGTFWTETFDVRISTTGNAVTDFTTTLASETAITDADGDYTQFVYDISAYNGQTIYVAIVATDTNRFYLYVDEFVNDTAPTATLDYYNLQYPATGTVNAGESFNVYAKAYEAGLTDVTAGQAPGIESWIGYSTTDTDPSGTGWTWVAASFNTESGNDDEYVLDLGATVPTSGTYYYASRWSLQGGPYGYGGIQADGSYGGIWGEDNNISGVLTVNAPANDDCANAVLLTVDADLSCSTPVAGTTLGSTESLPGCVGTANDDVWYSFVATATAHTIMITNTGGATDIVTQIFDSCAGNSLLCQDTPNSPIIVGGLTPSNTYYFRVYTYSSTVTVSTSFTVCVGTPPTPPVNDDCANALALTESADDTCANAVNGTTVDATPFASGACSSAGKDVWYAFTPAQTSSYKFNVTEILDYGTSSTYVTLYSGTCGSLTFTQIGSSCTTTSFSSRRLTSGITYYVNVRSTSTTAGVDFSLCAYPITTPVNDECDSAIALTVNSDLNCGTVTPGTTVSATESAQMDDVSGTPNNDVWFTFVATGAAHRVSLTDVVAVVGTSTDMGIGVYDGSGGCDALVFTDTSDPNTLNLTGLTSGVTYYVRVYGWSSSVTSTAQATFNVCIGTPLDPPANDDCANALVLAESADDTCANSIAGTTVSATPSSSGTCSTAGKDVWYAFTPSLNAIYTFSVTETMDFGTSSTYVAVYSGACGSLTQLQGSCVTPSFTSDALTAGTVYYVNVRSSSSSTGVNFNLCAYPQVPLANDDCSNAVSLTPGLVYTDNPMDGTVAGATLNGETGSCGSNGPGIWYSVVVPGDGNITIETGADTATSTTGFDSVIEVFSGSCGALVSVDCDDDGAATGNYSLLELTGLTPGATIYVRVWEYGGNESEPFSISAYSSTLSVGEIDNQQLFSYFPNPVKNELTLRAQSNIENVSIYNMLGQEVLRTSPNSIATDVNMSALQTGAYFVKVTINDVTETIRVIKQ